MILRVTTSIRLVFFIYYCFTSTYWTFLIVLLQAHRVFVPNVSLTANTRDSTTDNNIANGSAGSGSKEIGAYDHVNEEDIEWDEALFAQLDEYDDQDDDNTDHVSRQTASTKANIKTNTSNANGDLVLPELATMAIDTTTTPNFDS